MRAESPSEVFAIPDVTSFQPAADDGVAAGMERESNGKTESIVSKRVRVMGGGALGVRALKKTLIAVCVDFSLEFH